jgi:hypothetical protein
MSEAAVLAGEVGIWDAELVIRVAPGAPEQRSTGVSTQHLVGDWLVTDFKNQTGFAGHGITGWDAVRKSYVGTWVDAMRPFLVVMEGVWDAAARTMTFHASANLPDGRTLAWREVTERPDDDTRIFHQHFGEHEMMTVTYRRRKG